MKPVPIKTCRTCGVDKPETDYYAHRGMSDGYFNHCKPCVLAQQRLARQQERILAIPTIELPRGMRL